jgi:hypothetical protein
MVRTIWVLGILGLWSCRPIAKDPEVINTYLPLDSLHDTDHFTPGFILPLPERGDGRFLFLFKGREGYMVFPKTATPFPSEEDAKEQ